MDKRHAEISYNHEKFGTFVGTMDQSKALRQALLEASLYNQRKAKEYHAERNYGLEKVCYEASDLIMDIWQDLYHLEEEYEKL